MFTVFSIISDNFIAFHLARLVYLYNKHNQKQRVADHFQELLSHNLKISGLDWVALVFFGLSLYNWGNPVSHPLFAVAGTVLCTHTSQRIIILEKLKRLAFIGGTEYRPSAIPTPTVSIPQLSTIFVAKINESTIPSTVILRTEAKSPLNIDNFFERPG